MASGFCREFGGVKLRIRVVVAGALGKMGQEVVRTVLKQDDMELVGAVDVQGNNTDIGTALGLKPIGVDVAPKLSLDLLQSLRPDILVDFTNPHSVLENAKLAIQAEVVPVIGTTGLDADGIAELEALCKRYEVGAFIAPNFAIGAILMMRFASEVAKYFPHVDIIELHHDQKLDAPSGTALKTAEWIAKVRKPMAQGHPDEIEKLPGARGGDYQGIRIHSVRLPGLVAHQEVIFGGTGQTLTIRHDALTRESFMPGVMLAIRKAYKLDKLVIGLENFLD